MKTIDQIFGNSSSALVKLIKGAQQARELEPVFHSMLDPALTRYCRLAKFANGELSVTVSSPAWATKLRYAIPDIVKNLRTQPEFKELKNIRYIISPLAQAPKKKPITPKISKENAKLLRETIAELKKKARKK